MGKMNSLVVLNSYLSTMERQQLHHHRNLPSVLKKCLTSLLPYSLPKIHAAW
jgi:hypothetical protein